MEEKPFTLEQAHRKFAADSFNETWTLLDKPDRTPDETHRMVTCAHASLYHWSAVGEPVNLGRGHWQISRVYAVVGKGELALEHARRYLEYCQQHTLYPFDFAYAYEALARASAVLGDRAERDRYIELAHKHGGSIKEDQDRKLLTDDLQTIP